MSIALSVSFNVDPLVEWSTKAVRTLRNQLRSAVDKSARAARVDTLQVLADDANVPLQRLKEYLPVIRGSTQSDLNATWNIKPNTSMIRGRGFADLPYGRLGTVSVSTVTLSGGGSANLTLRKVFVIHGRNGGTVVMVRVGRGRNAVKAIYSTRVSTIMLQVDSIPRLTWERSAEKNLAGLAAAAVARAFAFDASDLPDRVGLAVSSREITQ